MSDADSDTSTVVSLPPEKPEPTPEQLAKSEEIKAEANKKFQESHLKEAIELYTEALELNQRNHVLYANRAFCHVKLENYGLNTLLLLPSPSSPLLLRLAFLLPLRLLASIVVFFFLLPSPSRLD
eukprot:758135-Hanusia_phi.AAC.2